MEYLSDVCSVLLHVEAPPVVYNRNSLPWTEKRQAKTVNISPLKEHILSLIFT